MGFSRIPERESGPVWYHFDDLRPEVARGFLHAVFTRRGGVSNGPFSSLNLGSSVGDDPEAVSENHRRIYAALGLRASQVVSPYQVHGARVGVVGRGDGGRIIPDTDALITAEVGVALLLRFADCVPILMVDPRHHVVALAHAGWRGLVAGVIPATVDALAKHFGSRPPDLWAGIGPAIGRDHYIVGPDVAAAVQRTLPPRVRVATQQKGQWHLDLAAAAREQLRMSGITDISESNTCTACHTEEWYSHRAEHGRTGRFGVLAILT